MAKEVTKWESDDGKTYDTELEALRADLAHWKKLNAELQKEKPKKEDRMPYHERGSHQ